MKGQVAILMELCRLLWREHPGLPIGLAITSDEERGGENGVKFLVEEAGLDASVAVIPDGGSLTDITIEEKGILHLKLRSEGRSAHAARPWLGENALEELMREIGRIRRDVFEPLIPLKVDPDDLDTHWFPTCSVTLLETPNDSPNRIPEEAEAVLDIRFPPPHTVASVLEQIRQGLGPSTVAEPLVSAEPTHLAADSRFLEITSEVTGEEARLVRACGGSDARFFCEKGIPVILSRPRVGNLHGRDEWIEIDSMLAYFEICGRYTLERTGCGTELPLA
ncbi:MAG: M20/M25/M40 family metallo-hydrolase, partial [Verrucomicrobiae bacterium]|nr:M20/M25/M40 family metallo-hydrolase [Verrucomicrobiae bacterium]